MAHEAGVSDRLAPRLRGLLSYCLVVPPLIVFFGAFLLFDMAFGDCRYLEHLAEDLPYVESAGFCPKSEPAGTAGKSGGESPVPGPFDEVSTFQDASARVAWVTAAALVLLIGIPGLGFVWRVIWKHEDRGRVAVIAAIVLALFAGWLAIWSPTFGDPPTLEMPGTRAPPLFPSVHLFNFHMTADLLHQIDDGFHRFAYRLYMICFSLLVAVVLSGMFAACYALSPTDPDSGTSTVQIADRMALMRNMLYLGSLLLSVGIIFIGAWLNWPATLLPSDQPLKADLSALAGSVTMYWGAVLSALLLSVYVPSALCLRARARKVANRELRARAASWTPHLETAASKADRKGTRVAATGEPRESVIKTYLQENRLSLPFTNHVQQVIAVFAPALMTPLINTISAVNVLPT